MKVQYAGYAGGPEGAYPDKKKECCWPVCRAVKYRSETYCWTQKEMKFDDDDVDDGNSCDCDIQCRLIENFLIHLLTHRLH